jgi:hypothetical protein
MLLPNILVWGFWMNGIDNDRHFLWRGLVGPYWHLELIILGLAGFCILLFVAWKVWEVLWPVIEAVPRTIEEGRLRKELAQRDRLIEEERNAEVNRRKREIEEAERRFLALPAEERNRILEEKCRHEEDQKRRAREQSAEYLRAEEERIKAETSAKAKEKARVEAIARSPEAKRKKALNDITGGGF